MTGEKNRLNHWPLIKIKEFFLYICDRFITYQGLVAKLSSLYDKCMHRSQRKFVLQPTSSQYLGKQ